MENPATWGKAERIVNDAYGAWAIARNRGVIGLSLTRSITDALREAGMLVEETEEKHPEWKACKK